MENRPTNDLPLATDADQLAGHLPELPAGSARVVPLGLTFDDVLLQPGESEIIPSRVNTITRLSRMGTMERRAACGALPVPAAPPR